MKNFIKLTNFLLVLIFLTSCRKPSNQEELIKGSKDQKNDQSTITKNKMEVRFSCEKDGISEFLNLQFNIRGLWYVESWQPGTYQVH